MILGLVFSTIINAQDTKINFNGDFRLRGESNIAEHMTLRNKEIIRLRLRTSYHINPFFSINTGLGTGSKTDPRTNDVLLSNFSGKLDVQLFTANVEFHRKAITIAGGKILNPFVSTDLVWDADVYPQGVSFRYSPISDKLIRPFGSALYFIIDEQSILKDSYMTGLQSGLSFGKEEGRSGLFCLSHYNYDLGAFPFSFPFKTEKDKKDFLGLIARTNYYKPDSSGYINNSRLFDAILRLQTSINNIPIGLITDFVINSGASKENTGFGADIFYGKISVPKDFKLEANGRRGICSGFGAM